MRKLLPAVIKMVVLFVFIFILWQSFAARGYAETYKFPWKAGSANSKRIGPSWWHGAFCLQSIPCALDFFVEAGTTDEQRQILAAATGTITDVERCTQSSWIHIQTGGTTLKYLHLRTSDFPFTEADEGETVYQGDHLGYIAFGNFDEDCGYTTNQANNGHLHLGIFNPPVTMDGWYMASGQPLTKGGSTANVGSILTSTNNGTIPSPDYDGDGQMDLAVFRPSTGVWHMRYSSTGVGNNIAYGTTGDIPKAGDFDGDKKFDQIVFRPSDGIWRIKRSSFGINDSLQVAYGTTGDVPLVGDYDGDGKLDLAVFRPSTGVWHMRHSSTEEGSNVQYGTSGDIPLAGDYDNDGRFDQIVFRPSDGIWRIRRSSFGSEDSLQVAYGTTGDIPLVGDYDGDKKLDLVVFRPSTGVWHMRFSSTEQGNNITYGTAGDIPIAGDYDKDGKFDQIVFRPSDGIWRIKRSTIGGGDSLPIEYGTAGDIPLGL
jgi:hypothetical protein